MTAFAPALNEQFAEPRYEFADYCLLPDGSLLHRETAIAIPPKELAVLRHLLARAGQIVLNSELHSAAWGTVHVSADSLPRCVSSLRARLGSENLIQTAYKRGYRFSAPVKLTWGTAMESAVNRQKTALEPQVPETPRLVILPFLDGEEVPALLGTGIAEEIMLQLNRMQPLVASMLARDSVFTMAEQGASAQEICRALRAQIAVTGRITAMPVHYRLRVEMFRARDEMQLWIEDFILPRGQLAQAQSECAKRIAARIRNTFEPHHVELNRSASTAQRSEAYALEMQARTARSSVDPEVIKNSLNCLERALELDPELHSARNRVIHHYLHLSSLGGVRGDYAAEQAIRHADTLKVYLAADNATLAAVGWVRLFHGRFPGAAEDIFTPSSGVHDAQALNYRARIHLGQRRFTDAILLLRGAIEDDPFSAVLQTQLAWALHLAGESDAAVHQARHALQSFPKSPGALLFAAIIFAAATSSYQNSQCHTCTNLNIDAEAAAMRLIELAPKFSSGYATLAYIHARQGRIVEARTLLKLDSRHHPPSFKLHGFDAPALVELGEHDAALEALAEANEQHCPWLFELLADPRLAPLREEPGFQALAEIVGPALMENTQVACRERISSQVKR